MYKEDLALNNQQWLICHKIKPNQTKPNQNVLRTSVDLMKENGFTLKKKTESRQYPVETMANADYADDRPLLTNAPVQTESLLRSLEQTKGGISIYVN